MKRSLWLVLLFLTTVCRLAAARSDDITLPGKTAPLFYLESPFSEAVTTAADEELEIQVSSIIAEASRILVRFYVTAVPESWQAKVTDERRLFGSYLPVAEIVTEDGTFLTPSSASRYSLLEYNSQIIVGGLIEFAAENAVQAFYLNFNQIPFDTQPLKEGFTKAVVLEEARSDNSSGRDVLSDSGQGLEFILKATAQTNSLTMLQPAVRMLRTDEELSKFGWISISAAQSRKRFAVTRGNLYGFDLADDLTYSPAHAYVFSPLTSDEPLLVTMDRAYVTRAFREPQHTELSLADAAGTVILRDEDFLLSVVRAETAPEEERIRLYIDAGETTVSDISFDFQGLKGTVQPQVSCGIDTSSGEFACDLYFYENAYPTGALGFDIDRIEYQKEGPWELTWAPVPMETGADTSSGPAVPDPSGLYRQEEAAGEIPEEVRAVLDAIEEKDRELAGQGQWIHESFELDYRLSGDRAGKLIPVDQAEQYHTGYIQENHLRTAADGSILEIFSIAREQETDPVFSAQWQEGHTILDLIHGLKTTTEYPLSQKFSCFEDFSEIAQSGAVFTGAEPCDSDGRKLLCLHFYHSLNGMPDSRNSQSITFYTDPETRFIYREVIDYDLGALILNKTTLALETEAELPEELLLLRGAFE